MKRTFGAKRQNKQTIAAECTSLLEGFGSDFITEEVRVVARELQRTKMHTHTPADMRLDRRRICSFFFISRCGRQRFDLCTYFVCTRKWECEQ